VSLPAEASVNLAKLLVTLKLSDSRTDAERKVKAGAVELNGEKQTTLSFELRAGESYLFHVGKKWKRLQVD
jgi:tyrosyl-tRNA synthetase